MQFDEVHALTGRVEAMKDEGGRQFGRPLSPKFWTLGYSFRVPRVEARCEFRRDTAGADLFPSSSPERFLDSESTILVAGILALR